MEKKGLMRVVGIIIVCIIVVGVIVTVRLALSDQSKGYVEMGTFVVLGVTLIALVVYAYDTHRMARIQEDRWEKDLIPILHYTMVARDSQDHSWWFGLINPSKYFIEARVNLNLKIYGDTVVYSSAYDGTNRWIVYPAQTSRGWFSVDQILNKKGLTFSEMVRQRTDANVTTQLTMDLEYNYECKETGKSRENPARHHYFDFQEKVWVPHLTEPE